MFVESAGEAARAKFITLIPIARSDVRFVGGGHRADARHQFRQ